MVIGWVSQGYSINNHIPFHFAYLSLSNRVEIKSQNPSTALTEQLNCASTYVFHSHVENCTFKHRLVSDSLHFFSYRGEKAKQNFSELFLLHTPVGWKDSVTSARYLPRKQGRFSKTSSLAYPNGDLYFRLGVVWTDSTPVLSATKCLVWQQTFPRSSVKWIAAPWCQMPGHSVSPHCLSCKAHDTEESFDPRGRWCFQIRPLHPAL